MDSAFAALADGEPIELMSELAYPIPLAVIAELFDVGLEGAELLRAETPTLARMLELDPTPEEIDAIGTAAMTLMLFLVPIVAQRREAPGEDLLSALVHPPGGGAALETDEIITMCLLLLAAGHETTANLIGNGTLALLEHPDQLDWLAQHPDLCAQAVDELLRYDSPAQVASRVARNDLILGGVSVRKGQQALVVLGAANRDPARYPDPDRLDLTRARVASPRVRQRPALLRRRRPRPTGGAGDLQSPRAIGIEIESRQLVASPGSLPHVPPSAKPPYRGRRVPPFDAHARCRTHPVGEHGDARAQRSILDRPAVGRDDELTVFRAGRPLLLSRDSAVVAVVLRYSELGLRAELEAEGADYC